MPDLNQLEALIIQEQNDQLGMFITNNTDIDSYIHKLTTSAEILAHYINGECAGFIAFYCNDVEKQSSFITLLLIAPEYRGKKIASSLIDAVISIAQVRGFAWCSLEVKKNNFAALELYKSKTFNIQEVREDSFLMRKNLQ